MMDASFMLAAMEAFVEEQNAKLNGWTLLAFGIGTIVALVLFSMQLYQCRKPSATKADFRKAIAVYTLIAIWGDIDVFILSKIFGWSMIEMVLVFLIGYAVIWFPGRRYVRRVKDDEKMREWPFF